MFTLSCIFALAATASRARADDRAAMANLLLAEQLADVATTQQLLHSRTCTQFAPIFNAELLMVGSVQHCINGAEGDPLARPFVRTPFANVAAALAVNGLVRLASFRLGRTGQRALRYSIDLYPVVLYRNLDVTFRVEHFVPEISFSMARRI
jgi:hypothetical protein